MTLPNPQVTPKAERRRFSAEYKLGILAEADGCTERSVLRSLTTQRRGRKVDAQAAELARLRQENEALQARLQHAETITASVREALTRLRQRPGKPGGQKLVVHIDASWQTAFIELPPEVISIRQKRPG